MIQSTPSKPRFSKKNRSQHHNFKKKKRLVPTLFVGLLVIAIICGYFVWHTKTNKKNDHAGSNHSRNIPKSSLQIYLTQLVNISSLRDALAPHDSSFVINHKEFEKLYLHFFFTNYKTTQTYKFINLDFNFFFPSSLNAEIYIRYSYQTYNELKSDHVDIHYLFKQNH